VGGKTIEGAVSLDKRGYNDLIPESLIPAKYSIIDI
jgi:hypothetical protein